MQTPVNVRNNKNIIKLGAKALLIPIKNVKNEIKNSP